MARDFDPNDPNRTRPLDEPMTRDDLAADARRSGMGTMGLLAALAAAILLGLFVWNMADNNTTATNDTTPGTTTGSSPSTGMTGSSGTTTPPAAAPDANKSDSK